MGLLSDSLAPHPSSYQCLRHTLAPCLLGFYTGIPGKREAQTMCRDGLPKPGIAWSHPRGSGTHKKDREGLFNRACDDRRKGNGSKPSVVLE